MASLAAPVARSHRKAIADLHSTLFVVVSGNITRGFSHYGPFVNEADARVWARAQFNQANVLTEEQVDARYTVQKCFNPLKGEGRESGAKALSNSREA